METRPNTFLVGLFVLILLGCGITFILWMSSIEFGKSPNYYHIFFDGSVTGLRENEEVLYQGIPVGKVKKITIPKEQVQKVKVLISIKRPEIIRENSVAVVEAQGLTGYSYIQIKGSTQDSPKLTANPGQKYPVIASRPSNIETLSTNAPQLLDQISKVAQQLQAFFNEEMIEETRITMKNLRKITESLAGGNTALPKLIEDFQSSLAAFKKTMMTLETFLGDAQTTLTQTFGNDLSTFHTLAQTLQTSSYHFNRLAEEVEKSPLGFLHKNSTQGYTVP